MRDINLLQDQKGASSEFNVRESGRIALIVVGALLVLLVLTYAGLSLLAQRNVTMTQAALGETVKYQDVVKTRNELAGKKAEAAAIGELLKAAEDSGYINTMLLNSLSSSMTDNSFLQSFSMDDLGALTFTGKAAARTDITAFTYKLKETGLFSDVALTVITQTTQQDSQQTAQQNAPALYDFTVKAVLKGGAGK